MMLMVMVMPLTDEQFLPERLPSETKAVDRSIGHLAAWSAPQSCSSGGRSGQSLILLPVYRYNQGTALSGASPELEEVDAAHRPRSGSPSATHSLAVPIAPAGVTDTASRSAVLRPPSPVDGDPAGRSRRTGARATYG
jgi:hypothetical protein